ncbi:MAG: FMN-binding protein [Bacteroidetes bacterium HGW-Bacteroidetes-4]|jgi:hypothetical protein|nr:MAG: FMN-binding protein [Bacteroidetes bacterium HGW-Bacteroidetes-4]
MVMRNALLVLFLLNVLKVFAFGPDYGNRALKKELERSYQLGFSNLHENAELSQQLGHQGKIFEIKDKAKLLGYVYVGRIISCRQGVCNLSNGPSGGGESYEYFDAFIIYDVDKSVQKVKVFNYQATHGHEISSTGWLKQFMGFKSETTLVVGKNIDALSGATISANALTDEINYVTKLLCRN